jgi:hypothetical protein
MHDEARFPHMNEDPALAAALHALADAAPLHDGWPALAARIARRRRTRSMLRITVPAALAAGVAIAIAVPHLWPAHAPSSAPRATQQAAALPVRAPEAELGALRTRSQRLQAWVHTLDRDGAPLGADALAGAVALQDRIGLVDLQLSAATDPAARASLWQERNVLLQQLGLLHLRAYTVAEHAHATSDDTTIL